MQYCNPKCEVIFPHKQVESVIILSYPFEMQTNTPSPSPSPQTGRVPILSDS